MLMRFARRRFAKELRGKDAAFLSSGGRGSDRAGSQDEVLMAEGRMGGATIVGDTVRKPVGPWTPAVHALLSHLEKVGFEGAPRVLGIDDSGREVLTYLLSEARSRIDAPKSDEALVSLGGLLRDFRESVDGFEPPPHATWRLGKTLKGDQIICHNDVNPGNVVYRDGKPYALIDWDLAGPGSPLDDFVRAAILFTPLVPDEICRAWGFVKVPDRARRLESLCEGYRIEPGPWILDAVEALQLRDLDDLLTLGRRGVSPFASFLASGSEKATRRDLDWLAAERGHLEGALS
jgi:hypothetical protein